MERNFLKLKVDEKGIRRLILASGGIITLFMAALSYQEQNPGARIQLVRPKTGEGAYEQELVAVLENDRKYSVKVAVEERVLTKEEALSNLETAKQQLPQIVLGKNESAKNIVTALSMIEEMPELGVEILWNTGFLEYFYEDGSVREEKRPKEAMTVEISAVLSCQEFAEDFSMQLVLRPGNRSEEERFLEFVENSESAGKENDTWELPLTYEGKKITWKKPMDMTFLYVGLLTVGSTIFLKLGKKNDEKKQREERLLALEKDYAQTVGKFAMLLSAGLSVRNAWERIVYLYKKSGSEPRTVYAEMERALKELQKGVPELLVYEQFGVRTGQIHYKKLMAMFISEQRHGSIRLLDVMEQEMLEAWEEQKRRTRRQGEKISTKLLLPMMGMLGVVFIMILVPAFLSFQI